MVRAGFLVLIWYQAKLKLTDYSPFRIEVLPMKDVKQAIEGLHSGKAHYRYVLTQDIEA